jgi:DnaJ-class molecular chaperone
MTTQAKKPKLEENYYQILEVLKTASLLEIRDAYEGKLEETQLDAFAAYSLLPEDETEEKLLHFSQAFVTLANPVARAKYDDELQESMVSAEMQPVTEKEIEIKKSVTRDIVEESQAERLGNYHKLAAKK